MRFLFLILALVTTVLSYTEMKVALIGPEDNPDGGSIYLGRAYLENPCQWAALGEVGGKAFRASFDTDGVLWVLARSGAFYKLSGGDWVYKGTVGSNATDISAKYYDGPLISTTSGLWLWDEAYGLVEMETMDSINSIAGDYDCYYFATSGNDFYDGYILKFDPMEEDLEWIPKPNSPGDMTIYNGNLTVAFYYNRRPAAVWSRISGSWTLIRFREGWLQGDRRISGSPLALGYFFNEGEPVSYKEAGVKISWPSWGSCNSSNTLWTTQYPVYKIDNSTDIAVYTDWGIE